MSSSYNFGELISCLRVYMPKCLVDFSPSNGGALLLAGTMVVGSRGLNVSLWVGEGYILSSWFEITESIVSNFTVNRVIFSSEPCLLDLISCLLASIADWMMMKYSSEFFSILLVTFGILKLEVWRAASHKYSNSYDLVLYGADRNYWANNLVKSVCLACDSVWGSLGDWG